jgi:hypothetical protein
MKSFRLNVVIKAALLCCALGPAAVLAQDYPSKPVRILPPAVSQPEFAAHVRDVRADFENWRALAKEGNIVIE